jgi:DNA-directed RNA polymerase specialized sigma24 family protein
MLVGDQATAEDVVQEAFLGLYRAWDRLRDPDAVLGYLRTAVVNGARSVHRSRRRARLLRVPHDPPVWSAEAAAMDGEDRRAVLAAIARLPPARGGAGGRDRVRFHHHGGLFRSDRGHRPRRSNTRHRR